MCDWNGNRKFNKFAACSGLGIELSENQSEIKESFGKQSSFLRKDERDYSRLMWRNDQWVGKGDLPFLGAS